MPKEMQLRRNPGRRPRLSDSETEQRMLDAGASLLGEQGLSLSLEHLSMEELISAAGVSRTSSYRRWPTKDAFAADLLLHVAENTRLSDDLAPYADAFASVPPDLASGLASEQGRRELIVELLRAITEADFAEALASRSWRSFVMLRAAHGGLPDGELRARVASALGSTERAFQTRRANALRGASRLMGYRLRDPGTVDWPDLAMLSSAAFTGLLVQAYSDPASVLTPTSRTAFGSRRPALWSAATLAPAALFFGATEPDPRVDWDVERIHATEALLQDPPSLLEPLWATPSDRR